MPLTRSVNYLMCGGVGVWFNVYVYRVNKRWWARYAYVMSAVINAGIAFMAIVMYFALQSYDVSINWWGLDIDDHCTLASCPTALGLAVEGCPMH
ncbi:hypothetical protein SASPL_154483 [Salvia splendens]|uniref:Oligopeptide transporter n=1 Tax=Salvia splendens TaxID=180675 RepID=A0A8X8YYI9_SALSN|nr:hypothetical protein SASPL_154483 [Salvia splendens]